MSKKFTEVKDSGKRQDFSTGSKRDTDDGKGQPHLMAGEVFVELQKFYDEGNYVYPIELSKETLIKQIKEELFLYSKIVGEREDYKWRILRAIELTGYLIATDEGCSSFSVSYTRLAIHYQNGAKKYDKNNWRKGQPVSRYYDSGMRHLWKIEQNLQDEDHYAALLWNLVAIIQTKIDVERGILPEELNDYPFTLEEVFGK